MATSTSLKTLFFSLMCNALDDSDIEEITHLIISNKRIPPASQLRFEFVISQIIALRDAKDEIEGKRAVKYDSECHQKILVLLCMVLKSTTEDLVTKIPSPAWKEIGFRGEDPGTDFKDTGLLGLEQLMYFPLHWNVLALTALANGVLILL